MRGPGNIEKTRGWESLIDLLARVKQVELAKRTGIRQSAISALRNLHKKPSLREALALAKEGIPAEWWTKPARRARELRKGAA